jgi:hypothetical protein
MYTVKDGKVMRDGAAVSVPLTVKERKKLEKRRQNAQGPQPTWSSIKSGQSKRRVTVHGLRQSQQGS